MDLNIGRSNKIVLHTQFGELDLQSVVNGINVLLGTTEKSAFEVWNKNLVHEWLVSLGLAERDVTTIYSLNDEKLKEIKNMVLAKLENKQLMSFSNLIQLMKEDSIKAICPKEMGNMAISLQDMERVSDFSMKLNLSGFLFHVKKVENKWLTLEIKIENKDKNLFIKNIGNDLIEVHSDTEEFKVLITKYIE